MKTFIIVLMLASSDGVATKLVLNDFETYTHCMERAKLATEYLIENTAVTSVLFDCVNVADVKKGSSNE